MDDVDLKLFELIAENPRCSYRDMGDELGISTPAVHRRIQAARESKILIGPIALLNPEFARAVGVVIWGRTEAKNFSEAMEAMRDDDCAQIVTMMGGNILLVRSMLKDLKDLDGYVDYIRKTAKIPDPTIGISPIGLEPPKNERDIKLGKVDFKIMSALHKDGRMSVSDISELIHVSPKTVRTHLKKILDEKIVNLITIINQAPSGNFVPFMVLNLEKGADKKKIMAKIKNEHSPPILEMYYFSNQLDMIVCYAWVAHTAHVRELQASLEVIDGVKNIESNIFLQSCGNKVWLETILADPENAMKHLQDKKII